ncbi:Uncharacterised protein [Mycobacteroides abscessus subsp. bolletii]|uniref:hypothetical protein n=1 Tax=Mycobacteroides abscessus TaxID=36809 RepID=UPI000927E2BF|nr:hypothetical protein [Mycobacteroides abscessus]SHZ62562.1 Uncharacterised protein [Mycobacteroides abscessus subsp. bolletii]SHZ81100.1 Uncharacterised protein [Mycobacteroides abscessus subsp. bolletii]
MVYRIDFDKASDTEAMIAELTSTAANAGAQVVSAFEERAGRYRIEPWDITLDVDWQVHLSIPTRPDVDATLAVDRLYLLARDLDSLGLRGIDRELGTPISGITNLDAPAREFAAQIERSKSPVPDALAPIDTDRVPWPTNWNGYTPFERIGGRIPSEDLSKDDARARFEQVTSSVDERITELGKLVLANGFELGTSPEQVEELTNWLIHSIEDAGHNQLRPHWQSVLYDMAIFVGESLIQRIPYLTWTFVAKGTRRSVESYQGTVIGGFTKTLSPTFDVFRVVTTLIGATELDTPLGAGSTQQPDVSARRMKLLSDLINKKDEPEPKFEPPESLKAYMEGRAVDVGP